MTVATDLQVAHGTHPVLYLAIDGLEPYLFQYSHHGTPTWSRSIKVCLHAPSEKSMGLDLGKMRAELSALTFQLSDSQGSDLSSFFGKLFSTGRWNNNPHLRLNAGNAFSQYLNAQATTIAIKSNIGFASTAGNGYIGSEAINWGGVNASHVQAVGRGLFSAINVGQPWGRTYALPPEGGKGFTQAVSTVPFSFIGRRVALYVTTWDHEAGAFRAESESQLLWTGRADDEISQDGRTGVWSLSCKSVLQEIDRKVPTEFPVSHLKDINVQGPKGLSFAVYFHDKDGALRVYKIVTFAPGHYTFKNLFTELWLKLYYTAWIDVSVPKQYPTIGCSGVFGSAGDKTAPSAFNKIEMWGKTGYDEGVGQFVIDPAFNGETCHPLGALGFPSRGQFFISANTAQGDHHFIGENIGEKVFVAYHPIHQDHNGGKLKVDEPLKYWADQGDDAGQVQASIMIEDAVLAPFWSLTVDEGNYYARYTTRTDSTGILALTTDPAPQVSRDGYVGHRFGKKRLKVQQVYIPKYILANKNKKGPFEMLLTILLSTGTQSYNGSYDRAPLELGLGIQQELVDVDSFLAADKAILSNYLSHRRMYVTSDPTSFLDLIAKEGQLFGYALVWRKGKLRVRPVLQPDTETWTTHLTDNNMADENEFPSPTQSIKTVVNQYKLDIVFSPTEGKYGGAYTVTDNDSAIGTSSTKQVEIKHPGIYLQDGKVKNITAALETLLLGRFIRFPLPVIDRSLSPVLLNRIFVGDLVKITSNRVQDPFGGGTRSTTGFAVVTNVAWNYKTWKGSAKLMLLDWPAAAAWSPAALVDQSAANGGFHTASNSLILSPHTWTKAARFHDGAAVGELAGWNVLLIGRAPLDPTSPVVHGPFKAGVYSSDNFALPLNGAPSGWNNAIEHVATFSDFADINATQYDNDKGTWQADKSSEVLNVATSIKAQRYR